MLPGLAPLVAKKKAPTTATYQTSGGSNAAASSYTFSLTVPSASQTQYIVLGLGSTSTATRTISSVVWNSINASQLAYLSSGVSSGWEQSGLFLLVVPAGSSGTTANVTVTYSGAVVRFGYAIWTVANLQSTSPLATSSNGSSPVSLSVAVPASGLVMAYAATYWTSGAVRTWAWTGVTEDFDAQIVAEPSSHSGAHDTFATAQTVSITATPSAAINFISGVAVALR